MRFRRVRTKILNTLNAYAKKISSGTILALLAISGLLFLVPVTTPAFASNASLPVISVTSANPVLGGASTTMTITISNPSTNLFSITEVGVNVPHGWTATGCTGGSFITQCAFTASGATYNINAFFVGTTSGIVPGQSDSVTLTATAATGVYPFNSLFGSEIQDASAVSLYTGPNFSVQVIDPTTVTTITVTPGGSNTAISYTAGTAPYTVTATVTAAEAQAGLSIKFVDTGTGATSVTYPSSFGSSTVTTAAATATTATASTTFQPSEVAGMTGIPQVTIGACTAAGCTATDANTITTVAGAPSGVTVTACGDGVGVDCSSSAAVYSIQDGTGTYTGAVLSAEFVVGTLTGSLTDQFGNAVTAGITLETCTIISFGGTFDNAGTASTTNDIAAGASCSGAGAIASTDNYFQALTYGSSTYVQVTMTGTYAAATFTASGRSQNLITSSMDVAANTPTCTSTATGFTNCLAAANIIAGNQAGTVSTITLTYTLTTNQLGVPITFLGINTTSPYTGSFVGGSGSIHNSHVTDFGNVTVTSVENSGGTAAIATATYTIDPTCPLNACPGGTVEFEAQFANPLTGNPTNFIGPGAASGPVTTSAGAPSKLVVDTFFDTGLVNPTTYTIPGQDDYLNVILTDFWGNTVTNNNGGQLQIGLAVSPSSAGILSATSVYISQFAHDTHGSFGTITFAVASSAALGTITITASGFFSGSGTLTVVSPDPTITVNTPAGTIGHIVYSGFSGVGLSGTAAVSLGVFPAPTIASVSYSVDGGATQTASGTSPWSVVVTLANGLHTLKFTATDSAGNVSPANTTTILVDTGSPVITAPTTLAYGAGTPICFSVSDAEGDLNAATVVATSNSSATLSTTVTGTNNPGAPVTYQACVTGLPATTGHWGLTLNAKNWAGNAAAPVTAVVQVTVQQAQSLIIQGTPTSGTVGPYEGVTATYMNAWSTTQNVVVFAVWKNSLSQTVYISAGSASLAPGQSQSFFLPEIGLGAGTYSVSLFVWTTSNTSVSVTTPVTVTVS